jgi:hypothetical protein
LKSREKASSYLRIDLRSLHASPGHYFTLSLPSLQHSILFGLACQVHTFPPKFDQSSWPINQLSIRLVLWKTILKLVQLITICQRALANHSEKWSSLMIKCNIISWRTNIQSWIFCITFCWTLFTINDLTNWN